MASILRVGSSAAVVVVVRNLDSELSVVVVWQLSGPDSARVVCNHWDVSFPAQCPFRCAHANVTGSC